jgi:hypothetical protein
MTDSHLARLSHLGPRTRFLLLSDSWGFVDVECPVGREDKCVIYNCCWPYPGQSFSGLSLAGVMTIFYCLRFETPPTWRARSPYLCPPRTGWPSYTPRHWVPFNRLVLLITSRHGPRRKHRFPPLLHCCVCVCWDDMIATEPLASQLYLEQICHIIIVDV